MTPGAPRRVRLAHHGRPVATLTGMTITVLAPVVGKNVRSLSIVGVAGWTKLMCCCHEEGGCRN